MTEEKEGEENVESDHEWIILICILFKLFYKLKYGCYIKILWFLYWFIIVYLWFTYDDYLKVIIIFKKIYRYNLTIG